MLGKECLGLFPSIFRRRLVVTAAIVAKETMARFRVDLHLKINLFRRKLRLNLVDLILRNQLILATKEQIHRTFDLAGARKRARIAKRNTAAVIWHRGSDVI